MTVTEITACRDTLNQVQVVLGNGRVQATSRDTNKDLLDNAYMYLINTILCLDAALQETIDAGLTGDKTVSDLAMTLDVPVETPPVLVLP